MYSIRLAQSAYGHFGEVVHRQMKQRIFSHFQDYLIQYISHQYQNLLYCNSSQYILSTYNSQHNNNNNNCPLHMSDTISAVIYLVEYCRQ
jgi:hypothetical protein